MQYPNITLEIKNEIPSIQLRKSEIESKDLSVSEVGIDTLLMQIADLVGEKYSSVGDIYESMQTGDWEYVAFPMIQFSEDHLAIDSIVKTVEAQKSGFSIPDEVESAELKEQLEINWRADILASSIEEIYNILIGSAVFFASELVITNISLVDGTESTRLREKMAKELAEIEEIEFFIG